jgi:hypothetical protein
VRGSPPPELGSTAIGVSERGGDDESVDGDAARVDAGALTVTESVVDATVEREVADPVLRDPNAARRGRAAAFAGVDEAVSGFIRAASWFKEGSFPEGFVGASVVCSELMVERWEGADEWWWQQQAEQRGTATAGNPCFNYFHHQ